MSRRTARALVTHGKFTFQNRGRKRGEGVGEAREPSKCTSKLTLHRPSIEPPFSSSISLLPSPRVKNGNYCRPTITYYFFFSFFCPARGQRTCNLLHLSSYPPFHPDIRSSSIHFDVYSIYIGLATIFKMTDNWR